MKLLAFAGNDDTGTIKSSANKFVHPLRSDVKIKTKRKLERQNVIAGKSRRRNVNLRDESLTRREKRQPDQSGSARTATRRRGFYIRVFAF